jgi:transposase
MAAAYSYELRTRVMDAITSGMKITKASQIFQVTRETIYQWKALREITGDLRPKPNDHQRRMPLIQDEEQFKAFISEHYDKTLNELAGLYPLPVSSMTICRKLKQLGYSHKKKRFITPKGMPKSDKLLKKK